MTAVAKRYFSKIAGAKFIQPDGFEMQFRYGFYDFKPEEHEGMFMTVGVGGEKDPRNGKPKAEIYQAELEAIVNQKGGNPLVYVAEQVQNLAKTPDPRPLEIPNQATGKIDHVQNLGKSEAEIAGQDAALASVRGRETGDLNTGSVSTGTDSNASTVDPALRSRVADFEKAERLRAEAAARQTNGLNAAAAQSFSK